MMAWLLAHIWAALAGVAVFGLLLGWSIRGMLLVGKMRRATVERDITMTELEQAKDEIERLYAAQRGKPIGGGDINIREELAEREVKISRLANELERAKKQLEDLKDRPEPPKAAASFAPRSLSEAVASDPAPALVWRNRHLESRVRHLENLIEQGVAVAAPAAQETAPQAAVATGAEADPTEVGLAADAAPETGADTAKEEWQVGFLRQRVEALEDQLIKAESEAKLALEATEAAKAEAAAQPAEAPAPAAPAHTPREGEVEEELARLRWRNRFLEGRLAYFEGDAREALEEPAAAVAEEEPADTLPAEAIPEERPNFGFQADEPVAEEEPPVAIAPAFGALEEVTPAEDEIHAEDEVQAEEDLPAEEAEAEEIEPEAAEPEVADLEEADLEDNMPDEAEPEEDVGASDEEPVTVADVFEETVGADTEEEVSGEGETAVEDETSDAAEETDDETEDEAPPVASSEEASRAILAALELDDEDETDEDAAEDDDTASDDELVADAEGEETDAEDDQDDEEAYDEDSDDDEDYDEDYDDSEDDEDFDEDDESDEDEDESDDDDEDEDDYEDEDEDFDEDDEDFDEDEDDESDYDDEDADEEDGDDSLDDEDDESDEEEGEDLYAEDQTDEEGEAPDEDVYAETEEESDSEEDEGEDDGPVGTAPNALDKPVAGHADDLTVIGGIGPKIQELLNGMGIWHYEQIAAWTPDNIAWVDRELNFSGRIVREGWVEQAAILAGDMAEEDA
ncbi:hypothetical protein HY29_13550 [Hyphomonas beringensis]|uniref:NADH dehydrogenase subunit E n=1 Tax=Hyphomonas beringensis TaxID=1280946 RepID=A0A062UAH7_9PROT|nr:hypothetical protein [Hyphomonas beringensis]KCZ54698.1 hypothetical protein HY29_13550 [Hyphomonas beringensis]